MIAWLLVYILSFTPAGTPETGKIVSVYPTQEACEEDKVTAKDWENYDKLVCVAQEYVEE